MTQLQSKLRFAVSNALLLMVLVALAPACQRRSQQTDQAPEVMVTLDIQPNPAITGQAELSLNMVDQTGQAIEGAMVEVRGDMTHAGMAPIFGETREFENGKYIVPFEWSMAGNWVLTVTAWLPDDRTLRRTFQVQVQTGANNSMEDK